MRLLSNEAKDWKSRVVTKAEQSAMSKKFKLHNMLPKFKKPWINNFKFHVEDKQKKNQRFPVQNAVISTGVLQSGDP